MDEETDIPIHPCAIKGRSIPPPREHGGGMDRSREHIRN